jgi:ABC-2 type transport system permease protein
MNNIKLVAYREIKSRIKTRSFIVVYLIMIFVAAGLVAGPTLLKDDVVNTKIGQVDQIKNLSKVVADYNSQSPSPVSRAVIVEKATQQDLVDGKIDILVGGDKVLTDKPSADLDGSTLNLVQYISSQIAFFDKLDASTIDPSLITAVLKSPPLEVTSIKSPKPALSASQSSKQKISFVGVLFIFFTIQLFGSWILMGIVEEKSSRVIEVLLGVLRPTQLLVGKVLGIASVVMVTVFSIAVSALVSASVVGSNFVNKETYSQIVIITLWSVLGFFVYGWLYAAAGAMCNTVEDAQNVTLPITIPLIVSYIIAISNATSVSDPSYIKVLSYFPLTSPFVALVRSGSGNMSTGRLVASMLICLVTIGFLIKFSGYVYRRSILSAGQKPSWKKVMFGK